MVLWFDLMKTVTLWNEFHCDSCIDPLHS